MLLAILEHRGGATAGMAEAFRFPRGAADR